MKSLLSLLFVTVAMSLHAQYNKENLRLESGVNAASRYKFQRLQLYPIRANQAFEQRHRTIGRYLTLDEALKKNMVKVTEHARGEVSTLFIENVSTDTVMILAGEVVQGGKQDRMIAQDVILKPKSGKKDLSVFCVEQGRWSAGSNGTAFRKSYAISSNTVRRAGVVKKDQGEVWKEVADKTSKNKAESATGTLAALQQSVDFNVELKKYTDYFAKVIVDEKDVIGVVAVSGEEILGCDMFATHEIFRQHYHNLIHAYATEAVSNNNAGTVPYEKVTHYLDAIISDEKKQDAEIEKKGTQLKNGERKLHISTF